MATKTNSDVAEIEKEDLEVKEPNQWKVILHNDDYTPMDLVAQILIEIFFMPPAEAIELMLRIHQEGAGVAGVYSHEVAEEKANATIRAARMHGAPLQATIEEDVLPF